MLIGAVFIVTAGVLTVVTFPTNSLNQAKMKTNKTLLLFISSILLSSTS